MLTTQQKYKMLALAYSLKRVRVNSVVRGSVVDLYKEMGISCQTYRKYINLLHKYNLTKVYGNGSFQVKSWKVILKAFNFTFPTKRYNKIYRQQKPVTFKETYNWLRQTVLLINFNGQQIKINRNATRLEAAKLIVNGSNEGFIHKGFKRLYKHSKKLNKPLYNTCACFIRDNMPKIVTGSYHLSEKVGMSQRTTNNILNSLVTNNTITRKVVRSFVTAPVNDITFDTMKDTFGLNNFHIKMNRKGYVVILGSEICFNIQVKEKG